MTTKFGAFDAVMIVVAAFMQTMLIKIVTGMYPPVWACAVIGGLTGAAWSVGATAARRRTR